MSSDGSPDPNRIPLAKPILLYQSPSHKRPVTVRSCATPMEAQLVAAYLSSHGIECHVLNQNVAALGPYVGLTRVELQVPEDQSEYAGALLAEFSGMDELEPAAEPTATASPGQTADGRPLAVVARFERVRDLFHAAALLGAARVECVLPDLVPRGNRPPGQGRRFLLRVAANDEARARAALGDVEDDPDEQDSADPRCPDCGSWRVHSAPQTPGGCLAALFGIGHPRVVHQCLACGRRWA